MHRYLDQLMISQNLHHRVHPDTPAITELLPNTAIFLLVQSLWLLLQDDDGGAGPPLAIVPAT